LKGRVLASPSSDSRKSAPLPVAGEKDRTLPHCLLIFCITGLIYFPLIGVTPWHGNEPTRVAVAQDMLRYGNWIIPTLHGKLYLIKPPLMNWLIAASGTIFGGITEWTSRIPSVVAMPATALAVYFLTRQWLGRNARLFAALAVLSMTGLLKKGASAEIDALFILTVTATLLIWFNGYRKAWRPFILWGVTLFLIGFAFLIKGPHAAVYFYLTAGCYLLFRKRAAFFFSRAHLFGVFIAAAVLFVYLSAVLREISLADYLQIWKEQILSRGSAERTSGFFKHLVDFPVNAALSFMPWLLFVLPALLHRELRRRARAALDNELVFFSLVMIAVNFPLYWLLPNAYVRYFLPAGPFFAIVLAAWYDAYASFLEEHPGTGSAVMRAVRAAALVTCLSAFAVVGAALAQGMTLTLRLGLPAFLVAISSASIMVRPTVVGIRSLAVVVAVWVGLFSLLFTDMNLQKMAARRESPKQAAADIARLLPSGLPTVYEIGNRRILAVTCYLGTEVIQLDAFTQLEGMDTGEPVYFLFDTDMLDDLHKDQRAAYDRLQWDKLLSTTFEKGGNEVVLGRLKLQD
jgi:4-amino-4-deoxy-L-arabinose transferase-like glycosyltransferase